MAEVSFSDWKNFLRDFPNVHILQTAEWGELKSAFGWEVLRIINGKVGVQLLFRHLPFGFTIAYAPKPVSFEETFVDNKGVLEEIDVICKKKNAIFLKVEPDAWEDDFDLPSNQAEFKFSPHNIQPPRTIILDLEGSEDDVLGRMKQKCRYNIRLAEKKGITVRTWEDIDEFHRMMKVTGGRDGFGVHSADYYRNVYNLFQRDGQVELLVAEFDGKPLAALMVFAVGIRSWYLYGASTDEERNRMPAYLLQWEAIRWARSKGCQQYDLWGIPDEEEEMLEKGFEHRQDELWGVYRFKRGFGGKVKRAAQALDRIYQPWLYHLYQWYVTRI